MIDYKDFSDEELICRLRAGESSIEEYLLEKQKQSIVFGRRRQRRSDPGRDDRSF